MKTWLLAAGALSFLLGTSAAEAAVVKYKATINGEQEAPTPMQSAAKGTADLDFDEATSELRGQITLDIPADVKVTNQHFHRGKCGESGGIVRNLTAPGGNGVIVIDPAIKLDGDLAVALANGELYINLHSEKNPAGEIRGQVYKDGSGLGCPATAGGDGGTASNDGGTGTVDAGSSGGSSSGDSGGCNAGGASGSATFAPLLAIAALVMSVAFRARRTRRRGNG
jgi:hypothetical protein